MYATWTDTRANLAALHANGVRLIAGPDQLKRHPRGIPPLSWGLDNGAWGAFRRGEAFDADLFSRTVARWGDGADWIVLPDIVAGGLPSLALSLSWLPRLRPLRRPLLIAVQDGMTPADLRPHLVPAPRPAGTAHPSGGIGLFLGGSTAWKLRTLRAWGTLAAEVGCWFHVGRVNSEKRIRQCIDAGATSADGTSMTRFSVTTPRLAEAAREPRHPSLFGRTK